MRCQSWFFFFMAWQYLYLFLCVLFKMSRDRWGFLKYVYFLFKVNTHVFFALPWVNIELQGLTCLLMGCMWFINESKLHFVLLVNIFKILTWDECHSVLEVSRWLIIHFNMHYDIQFPASRILYLVVLLVWMALSLTLSLFLAVSFSALSAVFKENSI